MAAAYAVACAFDASFFGSLISDGTPYGSWTSTSWLDRFAQRLLAGDPPRAHRAPPLRRCDAAHLATFRYDMFIEHVCAFRWFPMGRDNHALGIPGLFEYYPLLAAYTPPEEDFCPLVTKLPNGEHVIEGFYPLGQATKKAVVEVEA